MYRRLTLVAGAALAAILIVAPAAQAVPLPDPVHSLTGDGYTCRTWTETRLGGFDTRVALQCDFITPGAEVRGILETSQGDVPTDWIGTDSVGAKVHSAWSLLRERGTRIDKRLVPVTAPGTRQPGSDAIILGDAASETARGLVAVGSHVGEEQNLAKSPRRYTDRGVGNGFSYETGLRPQTWATISITETLPTVQAQRSYDVTLNGTPVHSRLTAAQGNGTTTYTFTVDTTTFADDQPIHVGIRNNTNYGTASIQRITLTTHD